MSELGPTIDELVRTMKSRKLRVPAEIGTFVALECAEQLSAGPALVTMRDVRISEDGFVSVYVTPRSASPEASAQSLVTMLGALLVAAGTAVPTPLIGIVESGGPQGAEALITLRDHLEAALVPLNRQAARRVLSRMIRETRRPATERPPAPSGGVDDDLDSLLGETSSADGRSTAPYPSSFEPGPMDRSVPAHSAAESAEPLSHEQRPTPELPTPERLARMTSEPPPLRPRPAPRKDSTDEQTAPLPVDKVPSPAFPEDPVPAPLDAMLDAALDAALDAPLDAALDAMIDTPLAAAPAPVPARVESPRAPSEPPRSRAASAPPPEAPRPRAPARPAPDPRGAMLTPAEHEEPRRPRPIELMDEAPASRGGGLWVALAAVIAALAVGAFYVASQRPELVDQLLGRPAVDDVPDAAVAPAPEPEAGTLHVQSTPSRAQVFLFVGRGPTVVRDLPTGLAHEFLVVADGHRPQRAIVPADARYETTAEGPRYELAAQVGTALAAGETTDSVDLGRSLMPASPGTPGELGSVRVITNPPGAKVFMLIGFTPDVSVENQPVGAATELLVWLEGHRLERVVVGPSDWQGEGSHQQARVETTLTELRPRR